MSLRPQERLFVLKMKWLCGACNTENICNIPFETHFFDVLLITKRDHARLGAICKWNPTNIQIRLFHPNDQARCALRRSPGDK